MELWILSLSIGAVLYPLTLGVFRVMHRGLETLDNMLECSTDAQSIERVHEMRPPKPAFGETEWNGIEWVERPGGEYQWNRRHMRWEPTRYDLLDK